MGMQYRKQVKITFEPAGSEKPGAITEFQLAITTEKQSRRNDREHWQYDDSAREVVAAGLTREQVSHTLREGIDLLSYMEKGSAGSD